MTEFVRLTERPRLFWRILCGLLGHALERDCRSAILPNEDHPRIVYGSTCRRCQAWGYVRGDYRP